jgi:hypothetical protein
MVFTAVDNAFTSFEFSSRNRAAKVCTMQSADYHRIAQKHKQFDIASRITVTIVTLSQSAEVLLDTHSE